MLFLNFPFLLSVSRVDFMPRNAKNLSRKFRESVERRLFIIAAIMEVG